MNESVVKVFKNDEEGYLRWVQTNPNGYILNVDHQGHVSQYPMVHSCKHKLLSSPTQTNYTTKINNKGYYKVCSLNLEALEVWSTNELNKTLTYCLRCKTSYQK